MKTEISTIFLTNILMTLFITTLALCDATLTLEPSSEQINLGDEFTLDVQISDIEGLFGASIDIQYDENILDYVGVSTGDFMGEDVLIFDMKGDNIVSVAVTMKAGAIAATGSGVIASLTFIAKAKGAPQMSFRMDTLSLLTADGAAISVIPEDESVTIIDTAEQAPALSIELSKEEVPIGEQFPVEIKVENIAQLFGFSIELLFDPTVLKAVNAVPGDFLGNDTIELAVPGDGSISVSVSRKAGVDGVDGSGVIAFVILETIGDWDTEISFNSEITELKGSDNEPIDGFSSLSFGSAYVTVPKPDLVARGKLLITWGYIRRSWKER